MDKLLEVQGKEDLEILTLGYCRSGHYISMRKKYQDIFGEQLLQGFQKSCKYCEKIRDWEMLNKHIINHHQKNRNVLIVVRSF